MKPIMIIYKPLQVFFLDLISLTTLKSNVTEDNPPSYSSVCDVNYLPTYCECVTPKKDQCIIAVENASSTINNRNNIIDSDLSAENRDNGSVPCRIPLTPVCFVLGLYLLICSLVMLFLSFDSLEKVIGSIGICIVFFVFITAVFIAYKISKN